MTALRCPPREDHSQTCSELLGEIEEAWRYVGFARMMYGFMVRQGRYNVNTRKCAPRVLITCECATDWGLSDHLAHKLLGRRHQV